MSLTPLRRLAGFFLAGRFAMVFWEGTFLSGRAEVFFAVTLLDGLTAARASGFFFIAALRGVGFFFLAMRWSLLPLAADGVEAK